MQTKYCAFKRQMDSRSDLSEDCRHEKGSLHSSEDGSEKVESNKNVKSSAPDQTLKSWRLAVITFSLCLGTFLMALDINIIGVAVPRISSVFKALGDIAWYGSAYLLTVTAFQPTFGNIYKFFNVKYTYLISIFIFEVGSILCAAAPNSPTFILGRAIAGLGAAGLLQGALCIIGYTVELSKRPLYMSIVISVFGIAVCLGPVMGGIFTDHVSWRWCFWINVPIAGAAFLLVQFFLKLEAPKDSNQAISTNMKLRHMDPIGTTLFIGAICCLLLALQWGGQTLSWKSSKIIGLFVGSGLLIIAFGYIQWKRGENATIPLRVLRQRSILMGSSYLFFLGMSSYVVAFYIPFYFQAVQGVSPTTSGVRFIPLALSQILFLVATGVLVTKWGYYVPYMIFGAMICILGSALLIRIGLDTPAATWAAFLVVTGAGLGIGMQLPYTALQVVLSENDIPIGNAIAVFSWQLGGAIAVSVGQNIFLNSLVKEVRRRTTAISAELVVKAGASNLSLITPTPQVLLALRQAYATSVTRTLLLSLATACVAVPFAFGMEWLNVKRVAADRKKASWDSDETALFSKNSDSFPVAMA